MAQNIKFSEPPTFKGDIDDWIRDTERYLRTVHQDLYGLGGEGGSIDGANVTGAADPGVADGTGAGNATVINALVTNLKAVGIVKE